MSMSAIKQINAILSQLTPSQRAAVSRYVDLSKINIMTLSDKDAYALLLRLKAAVATTTNPIKDSVDNRQKKLDDAKKDAISVWEEARKAYYAQLSVLNSDKTDENQEKADDLYLEMRLEGDKMLSATKRANNSAIQNILFDA